MDSTMVDYAIGKLNDAFTQIAPTAVNLGNEFIAYTVFKAVVSAITLPLVTALLVYTAFRLLSEMAAILKERGAKYNADQEILYGSGGLITGSVAFFFAIISLVAIYDGILAVAYPLMFTLESLAK